MRNCFFLKSLVCLLAVSCTVREIDIKDIVPNKDNVFYASLESYSEPDTRVYLDENIKILWDAKDQISIFNMTTRNQQYEFAGGSGDNSGYFNPISEGERPEEQLSYIYAVYPYHKETKINKEGVMTLNLPGEQTYREGSFGPGANAMVSVTEDNLLKFKNLGGYLVLKFYGEGVSLKSIKLEGKNDELLSGNARVTPKFGDVPSMIMEKNAGKSITLICETPVELCAKKEDAIQFWMVVPPVDFTKGFKLTLTDTEGNEFVKETSATLSITRNDVLRISAVRVMMKPVEYAKTSTLSVGSTYLIVDVDDQRLFKGAKDGSYVSVSPENSIITDTDGSLANYEFTVENKGDKYFLKFNDGKYIVCNYNGNSSAGLAYVDTQDEVKYPYAVSTGNNGAFFFSTTRIDNTSDVDQVLYYRTPGSGSGTDVFKIGKTGRGIGVHLYMKNGKLDRNLSFSEEEVLCFLGETPQKPVLNGTYSSVTYTSSDDKIATVDADGNVTPHTTGTVTITATVDEDAQYNAATASYTLRIKRLKTTPQYVRVTSANQINTDGEYVLVYDDGANPKVFKPVLNTNKTAFMTTNNATDVTIDDDEIEASDVDGYRILLTNRQDKKFALLVPEADGLTDYYLVASMSSSVFVASTTESGYRTSISLTPQGVLTMTANNGNAFRYASGAFSLGSNAENMYLFVRNQSPVKQRQYPYFEEGTVNWTVGDGYELGGSYDPQPVLDAHTTVTYSAEPESVAKVENGKIKIMGAGTATITATAAKSDKYFTASASYTLRIRNAAGGWVDLGSFSLENEALTKYLNEANNSYTDTNDNSVTVMDKYSGSNYSYIDRKDCPAPVHLTWTDAASSSTVISIFKNDTLENPVWTQNATDKATSADVYNLIPGRKYYYTISENGEIWEKGYFNTTGRRRMLKVSDKEAKARANNCRDLGGLEVTLANGEKKTIQYGILFRGSCMDRTTDTEKSFIVNYMNVALDVDLRDGNANSPGSNDDGNSVCYQPFGAGYNVAYNSQKFASGQTIADLTTSSKVYNVLTDIFQTVKSGKSVYFHCHIGADRTGYIAMLIEGLLGVSEKDCSIDYELTSFSDAAGQRFRNGQPVWYTFRSGIQYLRDLPGTTFQNKIENYLVNTVGIPQADIDEFKGIMLK